MSDSDLIDSLLLKIQAAKTTIMRGDQGASLYQLEDASLAIAALCNRIANPNDDSMTSEQQAKRRRTESKATDSESLTAESPTANLSPSSARRTPSVAHSLSAIRSTPTPIQQQQQHNLSYYQESLAPGSASQYQYTSQQHTPQSHISAYSQASTPVPSASALAQAHPRYFSSIAPSTSQQQLPSYQELGASPHLVSAAAVTAPSASTAPVVASASTPHHQLPQPFVSPHTIPASMLGQSPAVGNGDYGMWLYSQQSMSSSVDRSAAVTGVGGLTNSTSVSPVAQHALAPADHTYGQFDGQMRYMAVPGQASPAISKSVGQVDRSYRGAAALSTQQHHLHASYAPHGLAAMQYAHHPSQQQQQQQQQQHYQGYHGYYHSHPHTTYPSQHTLQSHIMQQQSASQHHAQQQQQQHSQQNYHHQHQQSPFTAHASLGGTTAMSDSSSGRASMGAGPASSNLHTGAYAHSAQLATEQASATAQMAAAVAAAAISAHAIPVSHSSPSGGTGTSISSSSNHASGAAAAVGIGGAQRLGIGMGDMDQPSIPAF
ncbi:hypothetical protein GGI20_005460, partial [Coemansia sp. BCRC 34301]